MAAVVVEPTLPFPAHTLDLANASRWTTLLPLMRPSLHPVPTPKGQTILLDASLASSKYVRVAAVGSSSGNFSSRLLDSPHSVAAIVPAATGGAGLLTAPDIQHAISSSSSSGPGVVVVRAGAQRHVQVHGPDLLEVESAGELEADHVLQLLGSATESCRTSIHQTAELLKAWAKGASTPRVVRFHGEKDEARRPAVCYADGEGGEVVAGFEKAGDAVQRELRDVMHVVKGQTAQTKEVVYSVHYADVNGLSRLENYILAKEVAEALDSENLHYRLSHSTLLDATNPARGWAVSICPISTFHLPAQAKPKPHRQQHQQRPTPSQPHSTTSTLSTSRMTFTDASARARITAGCAALIAAEPRITEYDTVVGDGDCGYTLRDGAKQVQGFIASRDVSAAALPATLAALVHELEVDMGGTSGALYCIFLTALAGALATEGSVAGALEKALASLLKYTRARVGDRTMMDALMPFVEGLAAGQGVEGALRKARDGVEGTKTMEAKLGRSTYLDESATQGVPDPGAYGLLVLLEGMAKG